MHVQSCPAQARGPTEAHPGGSMSSHSPPGPKEDSKRAGPPPQAPRCRRSQEPSRPAGSPLGSYKSRLAAGDMAVIAYSWSSPRREDTKITPYGVTTNGSSNPRACGFCKMRCKGGAPTGRAGPIGPVARSAVRQRKLTGRSPALYDFELRAGSTAARYMRPPARSGRPR